MIHDPDLDFAQMRVGLCEALYINGAMRLLELHPHQIGFFSIKPKK